MVRLKFKCTSKTITESGSTLQLNAVGGNSEENKKFFKYTPSGSLNVGVVNPEAAEQFEVGKEYYIDITEA